MKKYGFYAIMAIFVVLSLYLGSLSQKSGKPKIESRSLQNTQNNIKQNMIDLINSRKPLKCEYNYNNDVGNYAGKIYLDSENTRADIDAPDNSGKKRLSHQINTKDWMYFWYDGQQVGMKISSQDKSETPFAPQTSLPVGDTIESSVDTMLDLNYTCEEWQVNKTLFDAPTEITFVDAVKFVNEFNKRLCEKCDQEATEASRILCKKTLKCE